MKKNIKTIVYFIDIFNKYLLPFINNTNKYFGRKIRQTFN